MKAHRDPHGAADTRAPIVAADPRESVILPQVMSSGARVGAPRARVRCGAATQSGSRRPTGGFAALPVATSTGVNYET
jgi:hypothetical protein